MGTGFDKEKKGKEVIKVNMFKKTGNNYNKNFKQFEKDLDNFASKVIYN
jgi:hypothetical protein